MKSVFIFLTMLLCNSLLAQEHPIINPKYPFEIAPPQGIPGLMPGYYLVRTDADYFNLLNPDPFNPLYAPNFPLYGGTGVILIRGLSSGSYSYIVESVVETDYNVIINTKIIKSNYYTCNMINGLIFLRLKKTYKKILVTEVIEEDTEYVRPKDKDMY